MKSFVERYTRDEFQLYLDISCVLWYIRINSHEGNYQPYQVRALDSSAQFMFDSKLSNNEVCIDLYIRNLKLDFAIQVWEIAQDLTKNKYPDYLEHCWHKVSDPIKKLAFTSENRKKAEEYFYQMLIEVCNHKLIVTSERAIFRRREHSGGVTYDLRLEVCLNESKITDEIRDKVFRQFNKGEIHFELNQQNQRFTFEEIKDYFVYCDSRFLELLNATDGVKEITEIEKALFESAENYDLVGMINAIKLGADINAIGTDGETAFTKIFNYFESELFCNEQLERDAFTEHTISIAKKLLELGADINFFGYNGLNALQYTAYSHNHILMKFLLDHGANPNVNYYPAEGPYEITSMPLDTILSDFYCGEDIDNMNQCYTLLDNAGAE